MGTRGEGTVLMGEEKEARRERQNERFGIVNLGLKEQLWMD